MSGISRITNLAAAGAGGSAGFVFAATDSPSDTSGNDYDFVNYHSNQNLAYKSNGNIVATWINYYGSGYNTRVKVAEIDTEGAIVNKRLIYGDIRNDTSTSLDQGGMAICVDENDDVYVGLGGNNSGVWVAKLSSDLQSFTWQNNMYSTANQMNGMGATSSFLWTCGVDGNNGIFAWNLSTGVELDTYRHSFTSDGLEDMYQNCHAAFIGYGYVGVGMRTNTTKGPYVLLTRPNNSYATGTDVNGYTGATSTEDYPSGIGSAWKVGDLTYDTHRVFVTGRQNRSGVRIWYVTELDYSGTQYNNGYFPTSYPSAYYNGISSPSIDSDGNCYFVTSKFYEPDDVYKQLVVKLDSNFNVSQAISFTPVKGTGRSLNFLSYQQKVATTISQDGSRFGFVLPTSAASNSKAFTAISVSTDLTSVATGIYDYPIQSGLYAGEQFEIADVTSEIASDFVKEVSTTSLTSTVSKVHVNHTTYSNSISTTTMSGVTASEAI